MGVELLTAGSRDILTVVHRARSGVTGLSLSLSLTLTAAISRMPARHSPRMASSSGAVRLPGKVKAKVKVKVEATVKVGEGQGQGEDQGQEE